MEELLEEKKEEQETSSGFVRRRALQALAAVGGATVLVNLPRKWVKPVVEALEMPAHAQGASGLSPVILSLGGSYYYADVVDPTNKIVLTEASNSAVCSITNCAFSFVDPLGQVGPLSQVSGVFMSNDYHFSGAVGNGLQGNSSNGTIQFLFNSSACPVNGNNTPLYVQLNVNGRDSNTINIDIPGLKILNLGGCFYLNEGNCSFKFSFNYVDPLDEVGPESSVIVTYGELSTTLTVETIETIGTIELVVPQSLLPNCLYQTPIPVTIEVTLKDGARYSNTITAAIGQCPK